MKFWGFDFWAGEGGEVVVEFGFGFGGCCCCCRGTMGGSGLTGGQGCCLDAVGFVEDVMEDWVCGCVSAFC